MGKKVPEMEGGSRREHLCCPPPRPHPTFCCRQSEWSLFLGPWQVDGPLHMLFPCQDCPSLCWRSLCSLPATFPSSEKSLLSPSLAPALPTLPHLCPFKTFPAPGLLTFGSSFFHEITCIRSDPTLNPRTGNHVGAKQSRKGLLDTYQCEWRNFLFVF